jgi:hypothetical protein
MPNMSSTSGNTILGKLYQDMIAQVLEILVEQEKKLEIKEKLIDPLIDYYKSKLLIFYGVLTILLLLVVFTNIFILIKLK